MNISRRIFFFIISLLSISSAQTTTWPVLTHYEGKNIEKIAMPVGGIGTGTISIGGNGQWHDVEIMNKPALGYYGSDSPKRAPFFMFWLQDDKGNKKTKSLMGPVPLSEYQNSENNLVSLPNFGFPRFAESTFDAAYPFATVTFEDDDMPVTAKLKTFNPFIPADAEASGIPIAVIRYEIKNKTDKPLKVAIAGSLDNFIGMDGSKKIETIFRSYPYPVGAKNNKNIIRQSENIKGIFMVSDSVDKRDIAWGTIALATTSFKDSEIISYRTELNPEGWNSDINDLWNDFEDDGVFENKIYDRKVDSPRGALSVKFTLKPKESREIQFLLSWYFPNRKNWDEKEIVGNYYTTRYSDAWDVSEKTVPKLKSLEQKTLEFVNTLLESDYPPKVKEAALFNSSTLRSQTTFRTKDGRFFGWEGIYPNKGSCYGNCSHVWNYEFATPYLFGSLAKSMRETEYQYALWDDTGLMSFRISLPLIKNSSWKAAAADGQMGTIMKTYREWQLSGDNDFLRKVYPGVKKALSFAWIKGGWDANKDGLMEGCQHNTMDIEYFGPNPEIEFWYLGALRAASEMAAFMNDNEFETTCKELFTRGSKLTDEQLFNGEYYNQKIQPVYDEKSIAEGTFFSGDYSNIQNPIFQIGEGCLVDQMVGQNMAYILDLGNLAKPEHIRKAYQSIYKYNHVKNFGDIFNNMRTFAMEGESGLILVSYPDPAKKPDVPLSYASEVWSGLEYTIATGMIFSGLINNGIETVNMVRDRYDGYKRNPFNEGECGNHYVRAMASWSVILALSEFSFSAVDKKFSITSKPGKYFWSNGYAWGNVEVNDHQVNINLKFGKLDLKIVEVKGRKGIELETDVLMEAGDSHVFLLSEG
ncbi:non-lysosomal glucosylceramidase [bacterium BMS3Abin03]|nr:non-lysosomal glucosylceramidase [bacterium BMS3Abin03]MCG6961354.1 non-lysosomal glucosylceramidase [bacterium BMS3Abin03]